MPRREITCADVKRMRALYEDEGWTSPEIATEFGVSSQTVRRHLRLVGATIRPKNPCGPRNPARDAAIIDAYRQRKKMAEILERFHLTTPEAVYRVLRANGITPNRTTPEGRAQRAAQGRKTAQKRWGVKTRKEAA